MITRLDQSPHPILDKKRRDTRCPLMILDSIDW